MDSNNATYYTYWSNGVKNVKAHTYWVHNCKSCRLAGQLEGHTLERRTDGDNPEATCHVCRAPLCGAPLAWDMQ